MATPSGPTRCDWRTTTRGAHARAMRRTLAANVAANDAIGLSNTFWAWMESVLALEEREELERGDAVGPRSGTYSRARGIRCRSRGAVAGARAQGRPGNVKTVADALRERRRDIERAAKAWDAEKARVTAEAGTAAGMAAASAGDRVPRGWGARARGGGSSADAVKRAATRASEELNARAAKAASRLPGLAQIKDAVAAADAERATARRRRTVRTSAGFGAGGTRVASEEFPPGVAERLVARGASFDGAFFDGERRREAKATTSPLRVGGGEGCARAPFTGARGLGTSARRRSEPVARVLKDAVDRRFGRDRLVSTHGWE